MAQVSFRFFAELNDFLPEDKKKCSFIYTFQGRPSIKDAIEAIGVPHPEVDLIVVNGDSVGFNHIIKDQESIAVYPVFESFDISPIVRLREKPLRIIRFILDINLGKLTRWLRWLGFDSRMEKNVSDRTIVDLARQDKRIILTRDQGLLKIKEVTHGYWVRTTDPEEQLTEVIKRFDLTKQFKPFTRCMVCNGLINQIDKAEVIDQLLPKTKSKFTHFFHCTSCFKIYWQGSHYKKLSLKLAAILNKLENQPI